ncbi:tetratricopeptide repeat protein [Rhodanobacter sp. DHB23]|uniref:tetratricopeptide repeat protein n=1 Tax=Rhodanobacter sp. DHB23 TaxID=2775923 RepID=UPI00178189F8|nr:tetratricopeptide repeat protein [Rhodanobacter sp. DHB23]MBD8874412.1 tetratricopeptide repeat protein [Rhodanobacter sp. DHB23]
MRSSAAFLALLLATGAYAADGQVQVLSATVKDQKIAGATVILQKNGEQSVTAQTDAQGRAVLDAGALADGGSLIIVKKDGYSDLVAKCPCSGLTYALSPVMNGLDGLRIVLTWGATPKDLDSHIVYPGNNIYWRNRRGTDANLDVDATQGFGPETVTLERKHQGETYVYAVHDYTDRHVPGTNDLSASQAKVFVYVGQSLVRTYYVPQGQAGNLWTVFRITGAGEIQDINTMRGVDVAAENVLDTLSDASNEQNHVVAANQAPVDPARAHASNQSGEKAYHAGQLDNAIALYNQAIGQDPNYGQAYSNLGLAYQKAGRKAEAIWADRKALALASGPTAATVRASSYYNIGRMYEEAGDFASALQNYQAAKREKANPTYDSAIERVGSHH